jgi:hypothetical protein
LQETWDETNWGPIEIEGYTSRTGVAIILSPRFTKALKDAGALDPIQTEKTLKNPWTKILLYSVYHPYDITSYDFNSVLDSILTKHKDHEIIMGGDMNA